MRYEYPSPELRDRLRYRLQYPHSGNIDHWYRGKRARRLARHFRLHRIWSPMPTWRPE